MVEFALNTSFNTVGITVSYPVAFVFYVSAFLILIATLITLRKRIIDYVMVGVCAVFGTKGLYHLIDWASRRATEYGDWFLLEYLCYGILSLVSGWLIVNVYERFIIGKQRRKR